MKITFKSHPSNLESQVKQLMRENYSTLENDVINNCCKSIEDKYKSEFNYELKKVEFSPSNKDLLAILNCLKQAYLQSGMQNDVECIDNQIKKLDVIS